MFASVRQVADEWSEFDASAALVDAVRREGAAGVGAAKAQEADLEQLFGQYVSKLKAEADRHRVDAERWQAEAQAERRLRQQLEAWARTASERMAWLEAQQQLQLLHTKRNTRTCCRARRRARPASPDAPFGRGAAAGDNDEHWRGGGWRCEEVAFDAAPNESRSSSELIRAHQSSSEVTDESSLQLPNMVQVPDESSLAVWRAHAADLERHLRLAVEGLHENERVRISLAEQLAAVQSSAAQLTAQLAAVERAREANRQSVHVALTTAREMTDAAAEAVAAEAVRVYEARASLAQIAGQAEARASWVRGEHGGGEQGRGEGRREQQHKRLASLDLGAHNGASAERSRATTCEDTCEPELALVEARSEDAIRCANAHALQRPLDGGSALASTRASSVASQQRDRSSQHRDRSSQQRDRSSQQRVRSAAARAEAAAVAKTAMAALLASTQPLTEADDAASTCWRREGRGGPEPRANTDTL